MKNLSPLFVLFLGFTLAALLALVAVSYLHNYGIVQ